jgi:hypothetical protein
MRSWLVICFCTGCSAGHYAYEDEPQPVETLSVRSPSSVKEINAATTPKALEDMNQVFEQVLPAPEPRPEEQEAEKESPKPEPSMEPSPLQALPTPKVSATAPLPLKSVEPKPTLSPMPVEASPKPSSLLEASPIPDIPISITKEDRIICNPFGGSSTSTNIWGLIHYLPPACIQSRFPQKNGPLGKELVVEHFVPGHPQAFPCLKRSDAKVGLSHLNVSPVAFEKGFKSTKGDLILDNQNKPIFEFFSLTLFGALQLGPEDKPGAYQLAVLSDDGSLLHVGKHPGPYETIINNNQTHPPRTRCSSLGRPLIMSENMRVDFKLEYFQGPRTMVSLMFFWRPVTLETKEDKECSLDISAMVNTTQMTIFPDMLNAFYKRGWKLLKPENFHKFEMEEKACEALKTGGT